MINVTLSLQGNGAPDDGVLVFGLHLDGAMWNLKSQCLEDLSMGDRFSRLPEIHFEPVQVMPCSIRSHSRQVFIEDHLL